MICWELILGIKINWGVVISLIALFVSHRYNGRSERQGLLQDEKTRYDEKVNAFSALIRDFYPHKCETVKNKLRLHREIVNRETYLATELLNKRRKDNFSIYFLYWIPKRPKDWFSDAEIFTNYLRTIQYHINQCSKLLQECINEENHEKTNI